MFECRSYPGDHYNFVLSVRFYQDYGPQKLSAKTYSYKMPHWFHRGAVLQPTEPLYFIVKVVNKFKIVKFDRADCPKPVPEIMNGKKLKPIVGYIV